MGESESLATLRSYIASRGDYAVPADCVSVSSEGYKNRGYTIRATDRCRDKSLGKWRVDTLTREVFRQREDGRFLRP